MRRQTVLQNTTIMKNVKVHYSMKSMRSVNKYEQAGSRSEGSVAFFIF
ncbi:MULTISPECIES: hypothetical protein [Paenibacillus]|nr:MULTISPECIES: hypothetical protein [Paenibacillus]MBX4148935.1 hypothetical protein [Paenibacillus lautus]